MSGKPCKTCRGRGRWQETHEYEDGDTQTVWRFCNDCAGTGYDQGDEEIDDFDLAGVGVTENDEDD